MRAGTREPAFSSGGLQQLPPRGTWQEEGRVQVAAETHPAPRATQLENGGALAIAATNPAAVPLEGYEEQTNNLVRVNTWAASSTPGPAGLQQQAPGGPVPREGRARSSLHFITVVQRGRLESGDEPSTRQRSRPRHRLAGSAGGNNTTAPPPPPRSTLGCRRRAAPPKSGAPERSYQRRRVTFVEDTQNLLHATERHQPHGSIARGCQGGGLHSRKA